MASARSGGTPHLLKERGSRKKGEGGREASFDNTEEDYLVRGTPHLFRITDWRVQAYIIRFAARRIFSGRSGTEGDDRRTRRGQRQQQTHGQTDGRRRRARQTEERATTATTEGRATKDDGRRRTDKRQADNGGTNDDDDGGRRQGHII
jgi:hypothetical protein